MGVVVTVVIFLLVAWLYREFVETRRQQASAPAPRPRPTPPPHQRVSDRELETQLEALRAAMSSGAVTEEEAVDSLVRTAGLAPADARTRLLRRR